MRILIILAALFTLAGCESVEWTSVSFGPEYSHYYPNNYISYTLGYFNGSYFNGYRVYGSHGYRYYHAPRGYSNHRHFALPPVVIHQHVHTSYCEHNYRPRNHYIPPVVHNTPPSRTPPRSTPPRQTPPRAVPPQVRNDDRRSNQQSRREDRQDRRGNRERKPN